MISVLRKISASASTSPFLKLMSNSRPPPPTSQRLLALAQQLRLYKPPPSSEDAEEQRIEETAGKVVSQVGFPESATPIAGDPERFTPKRAAVLICLFEGDDGELRVILTKRSSGLSIHSGFLMIGKLWVQFDQVKIEAQKCDTSRNGWNRSLSYIECRKFGCVLFQVIRISAVGEVSLPGGKAEEGDKDDGHTATREAKEEIALDPSLVSVVTILEPFLSKHFLRVMPVIGILTDKKSFKPIPNPAEVEAVFDAPLEMFIKDENRRDEEIEWLGNKCLIHFFDHEVGNKKYLIWGLTAGILIRAASVVYQRPPAFLEQNPKFRVPRM